MKKVLKSNIQKMISGANFKALEIISEQQQYCLKGGDSDTVTSIIVEEVVIH